MEIITILADFPWLCETYTIAFQIPFALSIHQSFLRDEYSKISKHSLASLIDSLIWRNYSCLVHLEVMNFEGRKHPIQLIYHQGLKTKNGNSGEKKFQKKVISGTTELHLRRLTMQAFLSSLPKDSELS